MDNTAILYSMKDLWKLLGIRESFYELSKFVKANDVNIIKSSSYIGQFRPGVDTVMRFVKNSKPKTRQLLSRHWLKQYLTLVQVKNMATIITIT